MSEHNDICICGHDRSWHSPSGIVCLGRSSEHSDSCTCNGFIEPSALVNCADDWTDDEWLEVMKTLDPKTPIEEVDRIIKEKRKQATGAGTE